MLAINYNGTDLSVKMEEFTLPSVDITLLPSEYIYVGYYKPINDLYFELSPLASTATLIVEYETAAGVVPVLNLVDKTYGLNNSGRVNWESDSTLQVSSIKFGSDLFWYRFSVSSPLAARSFYGINSVFSDDNDLKEAYPGIENNMPTGATSFINFHVSARKDIVQTLRKKYTAKGKLLTHFDLLENEEVRQASKYLALSKIFDWLSDAPGDNWSIKAKQYLSRASDYLSNITITIDENDNGTKEVTEQNTIQYVRVVRV
jgi:hypothetical protein